MLTEWTFWGK